MLVRPFVIEMRLHMRWCVHASVLVHAVFHGCRPACVCVNALLFIFMLVYMSVHHLLRANACNTEEEMYECTYKFVCMCEWFCVSLHV